MARYIDLETELAQLQKDFDRNPNATRQYAVILPVQLALRVVRQCIALGVQPSKWMRETLSDRLDQDEFGLHMKLDPPTRDKLDLAAKAYGVSREDALKYFMAEYLEAFADHVEAKLHAKEERWKELNKVQVKGRK